MTVQPYWVVGPGRLGLSIGSVLAEAGAVEELTFVGRRPTEPDHPAMAQPMTHYRAGFARPPPDRTRLLLTVPDGVIAEVGTAIAELGAPGSGCVALHTSGALSAEVLAPLSAVGYAVGSLHPLQTVADARQGADRLRGAFFTFEGDAAARVAASEIVAAAGGRMLEVHAADKARYHAACVFASNYVVACAAIATRILADAVGISGGEAAQALQPLWTGAAANLAELGLPRALTGPVARGDVGTVKRHLAALDGDARQLYRYLARQALVVSRELGLDEDAAAAIAREIDDEQEWSA